MGSKRCQSSDMRVMQIIRAVSQPRCHVAAQKEEVGESIVEAAVKVSTLQEPTDASLN